MSLEETSAPFVFADALGQVCQLGATGLLLLEREGQAVHVYLVEGRVVRAVPEKKSRRNLLGTMMVRSEVLTWEQLEQALRIQKRTLRRLGDILVGEGMVDRQTISQMHRLQTKETLHRVFLWKEGTYVFEPKELDLDPAASESLDTEQLVEEGKRLAAEWPTIKEKIPALEAKVRASGRARVTGRDKSKPRKKVLKDLTPSEQTILSLLEDGDSIQRVADASKLGRFEACKAVSQLMDKGLIELDSPSSVGKPKERMLGAELLVGLRRTVAWVGVGLIVLAGTGVLAYVSLGSGKGSLAKAVPRYESPLLEAGARARIENALEVWRLEQGTYPQHLEHLVESELLLPIELVYPHGDPWVYRIAEEEPRGYLLLRPIP